jgi:hypothetical protein
MVERPVPYLEPTAPAAACTRAILVRSTGRAGMKSMVKVDRRRLAVGSLPEVSGQCVQPLLLKFYDISLDHTYPLTSTNYPSNAK